MTDEQLYLAIGVPVIFNGALALERTGAKEMLTKMQISHRTPVYDHADTLLFLADRDRVLELARQPNALVIYSDSGRVRAIRLAPDWSPRYLPSRRPSRASS